ncbi:MAG: MATE family efflux transporter [Planctomycetes bacterium]|nr:MATE family efflux transporter [Planctomycetota bacterium]
MDAGSTTTRTRLPAVSLDAQGKRHIDWRAIFALVFPLFINNSIQSVLNLTDLWFIGRISSTATAAMGSIFYLTIVFTVFFGGVGMAVHTMVAQAYGGGRQVRAAQATWTGLWGAVLTLPFFVIIAFNGRVILAPFQLDPAIEAFALEYWLPRVLGGALNVALWGMTAFFNGTSRTRVTLIVMTCVTLANFPLNELFMFQFGWGMAGAGWATTAAQAIGIAIVIILFLRAPLRREFKSHLVWKPRLKLIWRAFALGMPMGLAATVDLIGFSIFMLLMARLGGPGAAATPIVMQLTSLAFAPAIGIALAGTTLVGQCIGAGDREWAMRCGNAIVKLCVAYMGMVGLVLALTGPWVVPIFVRADDPQAAAVISLALQLLWIAAAYQVFDATNLSTSFALRGAGDVRVPAAFLVVLSWGVFIPLCHILTFSEGQGLVGFLPHVGWGAAGGWIAAVIYVVLLACAMFTRWISGAWKKFGVVS